MYKNAFLRTVGCGLRKRPDDRSASCKSCAMPLCVATVWPNFFKHACTLRQEVLYLWRPVWIRHYKCLLKKATVENDSSP
jgi:hypothetical protein